MSTPIVQQPRPRLSNKRNNLIAIVLAAFALFMYTQGTFDNLLWHVGLNYTECGTNGFGATFCGDDLKQYNQRISQVTTP